jgi:hypothetical protein
LNVADVPFQRSEVFLNGVRQMLESLQHLDGYRIGGVVSRVLEMIS